MVPGDSDLETCREHIQRLQEVRRTEEWSGSVKMKRALLCITDSKKETRTYTKHDEEEKK